MQSEILRSANMALVTVISVRQLHGRQASQGAAALHVEGNEGVVWLLWRAAASMYLGWRTFEANRTAPRLSY